MLSKYGLSYRRNISTYTVFLVPKNGLKFRAYFSTVTTMQKMFVYNILHLYCLTWKKITFMTPRHIFLRYNLIGRRSFKNNRSNQIDKHFSHKNKKITLFFEWFDGTRELLNWFCFLSDFQGKICKSWCHKITEMGIKKGVVYQSCTIGKIYTSIFPFFGKELSILRFESWDRSQIKGLVILHSIGVFEFLNSFIFEK